MATFIQKSFALMQELFHGFYAKILVSIIILLVGFILGKILGKLTNKMFHEIELNNILRRATKVNLQVEQLMGHFVRYFVYFITIVTALSQLGIITTVLQMLSAAVIILIIVGILLGVKDFVPNMFAGFYIYRNKFLEVGEVVQVKGITGTVKDITLVETKLETKSGDVVYIPNGVIIKTEVIKLKTNGKKGKKKSKKKD
tara:strand:- start:203 stop:802 length:600 start_codon:yes stop_codon:yes gene_type:complete